MKIVREKWKSDKGGTALSYTSTNKLGPYVFENIIDGVILLTHDGTIAYMNKSAQNMLSLREDQLNRSLPGMWLQQMDSRNDELCQTVLDALYNKHELICRKADFYRDNGERQVFYIRSSYWKASDEETADGILLILQDITYEERLKKEKEDAILIFSLLLAVIGIWVLFYSALVRFGIYIPMFAMTYILLGIGMILGVIAIRKTDLKISDMGLSFRNIRGPVLANVIFSLSACLIMIAAKAIAIWRGTGLFPEGQPFFDFRFTLGMKLYPLSVLLQEILSQSIIHECLMRILQGKYSHILSVFLSAVLFTTLHYHRGFEFMIGSMILVCVIGIIYRKQRTVWGLCITHYSVTMMAYFLNWL